MQIGPWWIQPYTLRIMLGIILSLAWLGWRAPAHTMPRRDAGLWLWSLGLATVCCGRIGYVLINWPYFVQNTQQIWALHSVGGLHAESAFLGALLCTWGWAKLTHRNPVTLFTWLTPAILATAAAAWWGCLTIGCAWGREVSITEAAGQLWTAQLPDLYHFVRFRYAVQGMGIVLALGLLAFTLSFKRYADSTLMAYCIGAAFLTLLRADPVPTIQSLRLDTLLNGLLAVWLTLEKVAQRNKPSLSPH